MAKTTLNLGMLGSSTAFLMIAGFSIWVALSLVFLGCAFLLLGRQDGVALRPFIGLGVAISATFCAVAAMCFIFPATLGAVLATALFAASWTRGES